MTDHLTSTIDEARRARLHSVAADATVIILRERMGTAADLHSYLVAFLTDVCGMDRRPLEVEVVQLRDKVASLSAQALAADRRARAAEQEVGRLTRAAKDRGHPDLPADDGDPMAASVRAAMEDE